jgi:uncharacterized SAM-binding protein YcdF (DUF218 family)
VTPRRLVAVLGYSRGDAPGLHPVCAARIVRAEEEARQGDAVLLSGWARGHRPVSEASAMAEAWRGRPLPLLLDDRARSTYGNAVATARAARQLGVGDVVLVTSPWHRRRASTLVRSALRGSSSRVTAVTTDEHGTPAARLRELACWLLVPVQAALAGRGRP